jgi:endonuclease YncB( thermonuclease family)
MIIRKIKILLLIFIIFFSLSTESKGIDENCVHESSIFRCVQYIANYDGDTIMVNIPDVHPLLGKRIKIRIYGINAPEIKTTDRCEKVKAYQARDIVRNILQNAQTINLENVQRDKYFRILAVVVADGKSVGLILLQKGLAYEYFGATKRNIDWCR